MRLPTARPKAPELATGRLSFSLYRAFNRVAQSIAHLMRSARRASLQGRGYRRRRERSGTNCVSSPRSLKGRLQRLWGKIAPKPDKVTACLATRLHNFPGRESFLPGRHFFMVSAGEVASPFLSTAPAVPAPYVLASFGDAWNCRSSWCATNASKRAAPVRARKTCCESSRTKRWRAGVVCASLSQGGIP